MPRERRNRSQPINVEQFHEKELQQIHEGVKIVLIVMFKEASVYHHCTAVSKDKSRTKNEPNTRGAW